MWLSRLFFIAILIVGAVFRFTGLNWDSSQHLHPDERFLTMVANGISWPSSIGQYFDTQNSPLNPHNKGFDFFVYGTFPIFLVKFVAEALGRGDYVNLTLVGRVMSAIFDLGTLTLTFLIANHLTKRETGTRIFGIWDLRFGIFAAFSYAAMTLPIQLSHFYTTDPYLTFFLTLTLYLVILSVSEGSLPAGEAGLAYARNVSNNGFDKLTTWLRDPASRWSAGLAMTIGLGLSFGLAIASKISAVYFLPIIGLAFVFQLIKNRRILSSITQGVIFVLAVILTVKVAQPYLFTGLWSLELNPKVTANWQQLQSFDQPTTGFPPAIQWITTIPYLHPLLQGWFWGVGPVMGIMIVIGVITYVMWFVVSLREAQATCLPAGRRSNPDEISPLPQSGIAMTLVFLWLLVPFLIQGGQFVKAMRYFSPLYPVLAIFAGLGITQIYNLLIKFLPRWSLRFVIWSLLIILIVWPLSFFSIYLRPHTRVTASEWIYQYIPEDAILSSDHWDDGLPLCLSADKCRQYVHEELHLFDPDTPEKWERINEQLARVDYLIITSNRTYGALGTVPDKFPLTNNFYRRLFAGELNFLKVAEFTSRPSLPVFRPIQIEYPFFNYGKAFSTVNREPNTVNQLFEFIDDYAEETWTVYDHPKVMIFKKIADVY